MNFGFNSNVRVGGALYHVQTEDRGPAHPYLDTVVYASGRVVYKRSASYEDFAGSTESENLAEQLHERLAQQHREVIAELEAGTLSIAVSVGFTDDADVAVSREELTVKLLNPKSWLTPAGDVTLEIELQRKNSEQGIGGAEVEAFLEHGKERASRFGMRADAQGRATIKFPLPITIEDGTSLVIRAIDGDLYGELRFRLKARRRDEVPSGTAK